MKVRKRYLDQIEKLSDYLESLEKYANNDFMLFRGQREEFDLIPKIARIPSRDSDILVNEENMFATFRREAAIYIDPYTENPWEWLAIAQHHGLPTRLLDWTKNPLAALWFAVREPAINNENAVVWVFETDVENYIGEADRSIMSPFIPGRTLIFEPSLINPRIRAQEGIFTIHNFMKTKKLFLPLNKNKRYNNKLTKFYIKPIYFPHIRKELDRCGINSSSLFPDIEGVAKRVKWKFTKLEDEE
ncbi:FRG domain-containing protein [Candidatus Latescibacterota bacterium]